MGEQVGLPGKESLYKHLEPWRGRTARVIEMRDAQGRMLGNNGDFLMHWVFDRMLDELQIRRMPQGESADVVIVPPNGAMLEMYRFPWLLAERLATTPETPVVVFPSSALFPTVDPSFIFAGRSAPTLWLFRERRSMDGVVEAWGSGLQAQGVTLALAHDVVVAGGGMLPALFASYGLRGEPERRLLLAARTDAEAPSMRSRLTSPNAPVAARLRGTRRIFDALPRRVQTAAARTLLRQRLDRAAEAMLDSARAAGTDLDPANFVGVQRADVSAVEYATFAEYLRFVYRSEVVVSNRLHVALPAAVLGRRVVLVEAGYHKLTGVYERSLLELPNVELVLPEP